MITIISILVDNITLAYMIKAATHFMKLIKLN